MKWFLLLISIFLLLGFAIWYVYDMKRVYKEEQDDFENANHLSKKNDNKILD